MRYTIVSTYPVEGTKNIGDRLIEASTKRLIEDVKGAAEFDTVFRAGDIENKISEMNDAAAVIFACFAIRREMVPSIYNFREALEKLRVPFVPLASGTSLRPSELAVDVVAARTQYDQDTVDFIRAIAARSHAFSCRGEVTYNFVRSLGVDNAAMTGDVAFYEPRFDGLKFRAKRGIDRIAVSTPHQPQIFSGQFYRLVEKVRECFPSAEVTVIVHGVSEWIDSQRLDELGMTVREIYHEGLDALDEYSGYDVHIGYRVHAHVSALKRRVPSYLIATDGRGYDYGLTLRTGTVWNGWKIVPAPGKAPPERKPESEPESELKPKPKVENGPNDDQSAPQPPPRPVPPRLLTHADMEVVDYILDVMKRDELTGFDRFLGFEREIARFNENLVEFIRRMPS